MKWDKIEKYCISIVELSLKEIVSKSDVYAVSLYSDESATSISFGANSIENFEKNVSEKNATIIEDIAYYKWAPDEWDFEGYNAEKFRDINKWLYENSERDDFEMFFQKTIETMISVLRKSKNIIKNDLEKITFFVTITDNDIAEEIENKSSREINTPDVHCSFMKRYD